MSFRFVRKETLEKNLGKIPGQAFGLKGFYIVYGDSYDKLEEAELKERQLKDSRDYLELCRIGASVWQK